MRTKHLVFIACVTLLTTYALRFRMEGELPIVKAELPIAKGSGAPDFTLKTPQGARVSLEDFRGSVVFLNFWRTDCVPCAAEMPDMEVVARVFKGRKFHMMPVSLDVNPDEVPRFYRKHTLTIPFYLDPSGGVAARYGVRAVPETFIIRDDGTVAEHFIGAREWASFPMLARLDKLIP